TIASTMGAFASIINNNVNWIMKLFTCFAAIMAIPMVVAGFFGMNVNIPLNDYPLAFISIVFGSLGLSVLLIFVMLKKRIL
ncbi:MAG: CorA family divalent cation transporter, partial [Eubacteriales bacterium]|nr:CorA family divalent cation transporter [Eubacteriales bacterium]